MNYFDINEFKSSIKIGQRLLCLDVGLVKIGVALSDIKHITSSPIFTYNLKKQKFTTAKLLDMMKEENAFGIVVGYPLQMDGTPGKSCQMIHNFVQKYLLSLKQPIFFQDERLSTTAALKYLKEMDLTRKKQEEVNDKLAASYILQTTLEKLRLVQ